MKGKGSNLVPIQDFSSQNGWVSLRPHLQYKYSLPGTSLHLLLSFETTSSGIAYKCEVATLLFFITLSMAFSMAFSKF
jgi:hypothetical protein